MSKPFSLIFDTKAHAGKLDGLKTAVTQLVQDVKENEPDTTFYRCYTDDKTGRICFVDTYASSEAFLNHLGRKSVSTALGALLEQADLTSATVLGDVTPAVHEAMKPFNPQYLHQHAGFSRVDEPMKIHADHKPTT